jgi:hypothetical protein
MAKRVVGRAYAFFSSDAPKSEVEAGLDKAREFATHKPKLELSLYDLPTEGMLDEPGLMPIVIMAKVQGRNFFLEASKKGASNEATANELASLMSALQHGQVDDAGASGFEICFKGAQNHFVFHE